MDTNTDVAHSVTSIGGIMHAMRVGFVGQGYIGKHYADDFEQRGFSVARYALEEPYRNNANHIGLCDLVFIAVPAPTTLEGVDVSIIRSAIKLASPGATVVIKSTVLPGTTNQFQKEFPDRIVLHSPEFLTEKTAAYDAAHPTRTIIGIPEETPEARKKAEEVLSVLPRAPYEAVIDARQSELIKYASNAFLFMKVVFANTIYDLSQALGVDYERVREGLAADPRIGSSHLRVVDASGHSDTPGRGAGGHCFIKDFAAMSRLYAALVPYDKEGIALFSAFESKNNTLLRASNKDLDLLSQVYDRLL